MEEAAIVTEELNSAATADAAAVQVLLNTELGDPLYTVDDLLAAAGDATASVIFVRQEGQVAAAAVARLLVAEDVDYYSPFGPAPAALFDGHQVGSLEALAVRPSDRGRGIGTRLLQARLEWLTAHGCDLVVAVSWLSGRPGTSAPLYRRLGFTAGATVTDFYLEESRRDGWSCPVCGNPCRCSAQLYWLEIPQDFTQPGTIRVMEPAYEVDPAKRSDQAPGEEVVQVNDPYRGGDPAPEEQHGKEDDQHPTGG